MKKYKTRIFIGKAISSNLVLYIKNKQHHFLKNVLRIKIDDIVNIFDGISGEWQTKVISINRDNTVLQVIDKIRDLTKSPNIWLIFGPLKQQRMNIVIQKATELGVSKIIPCLTDRTNVRNLNIDNLKENAIEAAEQSYRLDIPIIHDEIELSDLLASLPEDRLILFCDTSHNKKINISSIQSLKNNYTSFGVLVGPEGGFSKSEKDLILKKKNILPISLGDRILRSDTAITVSLFLVLELLF
tara:strand:- start:189 stop:917 length:729 start_codon:yes stop_codon:yes gene_type:complete